MCWKLVVSLDVLDWVTTVNPSPAGLATATTVSRSAVSKIDAHRSYVLAVQVAGALTLAIVPVLPAPAQPVQEWMATSRSGVAAKATRAPGSTAQCVVEAAGSHVPDAVLPASTPPLIAPVTTMR